MKKPSDTQTQREHLRNNIIGLGERSIRKSYYPELQKRIAELEKANEDLLLEIAERQQAQASQKKLEQLLRQAQKMEAIGTLAGGIAHDFNNILSAIIGYTELAKISLLTADFTEKTKVTNDLEQVLLAGQRAKELVQQILAYSRQQDYQRKPIQLNTIIREALKLLRSSIPKSVEIRENIVGHNTLILADPIQVHQIIMNLCTNANHAMRDKGGILAVELEHTEIHPDDEKSTTLPLTPGPYLLLKICDNGRGMEKAIQDRIFDPYFTTKNPGEGTGMGLAVVLGIVKSYNGHISVYSEPGKGSSFLIYLPRIIQEDVLADEMYQIEIPAGTERILVIDDEVTIADMEQRLLESLGYQATSITSPFEALQLIEAQPHRYDLVLTDMTMPRMNGAELAQKILRIRADMPVILCTGFSEMMNKKKARAIGIRDYVMKPLIRKDIADAIRKVLDA
jgi:signal transduction histidine kinase/ActR/RegA family two-component response regulator